MFRVMRSVFWMLCGWVFLLDVVMATPTLDWSVRGCGDHPLASLTAAQSGGYWHRHWSSGHYRVRVYVTSRPKPVTVVAFDVLAQTSHAAFPTVLHCQSITSPAFSAGRITAIRINSASKSAATIQLDLQQPPFTQASQAVSFTLQSNGHLVTPQHV